MVQKLLELGASETDVRRRLPQAMGGEPGGLGIKNFTDYETYGASFVEDGIRRRLRRMMEILENGSYAHDSRYD
jgi:hypothetical protein